MEQSGIKKASAESPTPMDKNKFEKRSFLPIGVTPKIGH
jgi:hypothetical protein